MRCLLIDDEPVALDILADYIKKVPFLECIGSFRDPLKALDFLKDHNADLIFLDINMPDLSGMQFLKSLKNQPLVIFTTAYSKYALEIYDYDAVDYLLKPIEFDRFVKAANKALEMYNLGTAAPHIPGVRDFILIKSGTKYFKLKFSDILYIKGTGNYVTLVTEKKEIMYLSTMKKVLSILPSALFYRVHKSYIINLSHVDHIQDDRIRIKEENIPVGELYRDTFYKIFKRDG
ncbi:MAG: response regulator transcription factor [Candidatus Aminicenantes bacterium]|nr:response regulator transcription factor [Candidatus Aminicenantes bacterium]